MRTIFVLFIPLLCITSIVAQVTASSSAGNWSTPGNWTNGVPANGGTATISHAMTMDQNITVFNGNYTLTNSGSITDNAGGSNYNLDIRGTGNFDVSGKIILGGDFEIRNFANVTLNGCDSIVVGGDADFQNDGTITVANCAALLISGDLEFTGSFEGTIDGNIQVDNEITGRNSGNITGVGRMCSDGALDFRNSSEAFGSSTDCNSPPCCFGPGPALPISLTNFSSEFISENRIKVIWETESEINNDYFIIEYSPDGLNFESFETVYGAGNSNTPNSYSVLYETEVHATNYFRLTQTDFNGKQETFEIIKTEKRFENETISNSYAGVFPNPGNGDQISLEFKNITGENLEIQIINSEGKQVFEAAHSSIETQVNSMILNFNVALPPGIYTVILNGISVNENLRYTVN